MRDKHPHDGPSLIERQGVPRGLLDRYLELVGQRLPSRIEGLYLVGSVSLGDYQPGRSDIDFVAVTRERLPADDLEGLGAVHRTIAAETNKPYFDGIYVNWADLERDPRTIDPAPFSQEGVFERAGGFEANPSTWLTLAKHPLAVCGPPAPTVWHDSDSIRRWNIENLNSYWRDWLSGAKRKKGAALLLSSGRALDSATVWGVSGVLRLHYTVTHDDVTSKSGACRHGLATFPERWHTVIRETMALRRGQPIPHRSRAARRHDMLELMELVIEDAVAQR